MRKTRIVIILIAVFAAALAACAGDVGAPDSTAVPSTPDSSAAESQASEASRNADSAPTSAPTATPAVGLTGVDAANYPRVDGSTANMPLMASLYSAVCGVPTEEAETLVQASGGTGAVWRNMMHGGADLLLVYEAPDNIKAEMSDMGLLDLLEIVPVGRDGLVFLVNAQNPVDGLTREQLIDIYTGKITDWSEVGGAQGAIAAFQRNHESGSQTLFLSLLMRGTAPMTPPVELRPGGMGELINSVAEYDGSGGAIGFSVYYYANLMYGNPNLKLLSVDGAAPTSQSIGDGTYPLVNDFYAVIRKSEPENSPARALRDWLLTDEGRRLLIDANYVPADISREPDRGVATEGGESEGDVASQSAPNPEGDGGMTEASQPPAPEEAPVQVPEEA